MAENELFGAQTPTPWSETNAQYRANALALLQELAALGARPALSIANPPYTGGEAADWWRAGRQGRDPRPAGLLHLAEREGAVRDGAGRARAARCARACAASSAASPRSGSRRAGSRSRSSSTPRPGSARAPGLQPASSWFEIVKLEGLAAKQVAAEFKLQGVWSWGWATYNAAGVDPDKPFAACVWLWVRSLAAVQRAEVRPAGVRHVADRGPAGPAAGRALRPPERAGDRPRHGEPVGGAHRRRGVRVERAPRAGRAARRRARQRRDRRLGRARGDRRELRRQQVAATSRRSPRRSSPRPTRSRSSPIGWRATASSCGSSHDPRRHAEVTRLPLGVRRPERAPREDDRPAPWLNGDSRGWVVSSLGPRRSSRSRTPATSTPPTGRSA